MNLTSRFLAAAKAAAIHLFCSGVVALLAATLVFGIWYPPPYDQLAGGRELFCLMLAVDLVCGPLLTFVLFNPTKSSSELLLDLGVVALLQVLALTYGLVTVSAARPLFLVLEVDRFKVIAGPALDKAAVAALPPGVRPSWWSGPATVSIRTPKDESERQSVLIESVQGGRDYAERPDFYLPYDAIAAVNSLERAKPITAFLQKQPSQQSAALELASDKNLALLELWYLPVIAKQDWVAVLNKQGQIQGFLKGDGF